MAGSKDDSFYDSIDQTNAEYDNAVNQSSNNQSPTDPPLTEQNPEEVEEWQQELAKLEDEITTLRSVLSAKVRSAAELKRKLGITPMTEMKKDVRQGIQNIKETEAYQKTNATFKSIGAWSSRKLGDLRNSNTFKSFEEKVGSTYTNVKTKVRGSKSEQSFEEALSAANQDGATGGEANQATTPGSLPEEKVPL